MSDPSAESSKPGPANPRTEGVDAPTPPGGPLRQDGAGGSQQRGATGSDGPEPSHGGTIPVEDEQPDPATEPGSEEPTQEENAETALDQPST